MSAPPPSSPPAASPSPASPRPIAGLHVLREVLPPLPGAPPELYLRAQGPDGAPLPPGGPFPRGARLSLDAWVNAFPAAWHARFCGEDRLHLALEDEDESGGAGAGAGAGGAAWRVALHDWTPARGARKLAEAVLAPGQALPAPDARGRLWAELTALAPGPAPRLSWRGARPPRRAPSLSVGLVTLGAEPALADTLAGLADIARGTPALRRVFLVDQGEGAGAATEAAVAAAGFPPGRLFLLRQPNLGGAGGFARGLAEAMALSPAPSHHLMMDDDIRLDPRMIPRLLRWLAHAREDGAVGGAMLDALDPARACEAGARIGPGGVVRPFARGADLERAAGGDAPGPGFGLNRLAEVPAGIPAQGFNGWWFFALPLAAARRAGLPAPLFLRGDDLDYARRLAKAGAETATPPGLFVWHEPFHAKAATWQHYYDLRNRLILTGAHAEIAPPSALDLAERLLTPALSQDYATARWRARAAADFLAGPEALFARDPAAHHREAAALGEGLGPEPLAARPEGLPTLAPGPRPRTARAHAAGLARALLRLPLPHRAAPAGVIAEAEAAPGALPRAGHVRMGRGGIWLRRHAPRRGLALRQSLAALVLALRYALFGARARRAWRKGLEPARSPQAWAARFAGGPPARPGAAAGDAEREYGGEDGERRAADPRRGEAAP